MIPMAVRLIFAQFACFLLGINFALSQMQNHGGQEHQFQHNYAFGNSYAFKWEMPFTYTYTIPPFNVDANQFKSDVAQVHPQQHPNYSAASSTQHQQQPSLQNRFGDADEANVWQNQGIQQSNTQQQQQQPSLQSRFGDEDDEEITTAPPQQTTSPQSESDQTQTELVKVPILDDEGHEIGWRFSSVGQQNNSENTFMTGSGSELTSGAGFGGGKVPQSTEPAQPVQTTQSFTTDSISGSSYRPQTSTLPGRNPMLPPSPNQQTELSQQTAEGAAGASNPPKMCTAQQISSNLCPGGGSTEARPSVSSVNFFTGQQSQDIDRLLQLVNPPVRRNAQFYPVFPSGDSREPAVVVGSSVSGGPDGGLLSYTFTKA